MIYLKLFLSFLQIGLFSFGGGYASLPLIREQVVEQNTWLSMSEFTDLITISQMTPGPIAVNSATFVGIKIAGIGGAVCATGRMHSAVLHNCSGACKAVFQIPKYEGDGRYPFRPAPCSCCHDRRIGRIHTRFGVLGRKHQPCLHKMGACRGVCRLLFAAAKNKAESRLGHADRRRYKYSVYADNFRSLNSLIYRGSKGV